MFGPLLNGVNYQWYNCSNQSLVQGETSRTISLNLGDTNSYALILTLSGIGCKDTSDCLSIPIIQTIKNTGIPAFELFPNPSKGKVRLIGNLRENVEITIFDSKGLPLIKWSIDELIEEELELTEFPKGVYYLRLYSKLKEENIKLILN